MSVAKGADVLAAKGKRACVECVRYVDRLSEMSKNKLLLLQNIQYSSATCSIVLQKFGDCMG